MSAEGVWAFKLPTKIIPNARVQMSDSDTNDFMLFVYHSPRRLVQRNKAVTVKLYRGRRSAYVTVLPTSAHEEISGFNCDSRRVAGLVYVSFVGRNFSADFDSK